MSYDIVIPVSLRNMQTLPVTVSFINKNIVYKNIIIIGNKSLKNECKNLEGSVFIDEDLLVPGLSFEKVKILLFERDKYAVKRTGWYFQQFLKMAYANICKDPYYLIWDADSIPVRKIRMFNEEGIPYFDCKEEYHKSYFTVMRKIFGGSLGKQREQSFISEHMIIKTSYMNELIAEIEANDKLEGLNFYEKIIRTILIVDLSESGFSEYETYGNYVLVHFPGSYQFRHLDSLRPADKYLGTCPDEDMLEWAGESYSIVTIENRGSAVQQGICNSKSRFGNVTLAELAGGMKS